MSAGSASRFDRSMERIERASIQTYSSLAVLNSGAGLHFHPGMVLAMIVSARDVATGTATIGDFVIVNAVFIQLYQPLNVMGMIYREIKQALVDIEAMFTLLGQKPEVKDKPGAKPLIVRKGAIRFENVFSLTRMRAQSFAASISRCLRDIWSRWSGHRGQANRPYRGCFIASTT